MIKRINPKQLSRRKTRRSESGNIFFTLFGAVAIVGVLGAGIMATMRGPLTTMVNVNNRTQAEAQMQIASKLAMLEASNQALSGDCDADGFVEPVEYAINILGLTGGGTLPAGTGANQVDPWGTDYGYCAWDAGTDISKCTGAKPNLLEGNDPADNAEDYTVIAVISAGPDRVFQTTCADQDATGLTKGGDDVVMDYNYTEAAANVDGLWNIKSGDPDTAEIDKEIEVTQEARFEGGINMTASTAALQLGAASMLFPTDGDLALCNGANHMLLRVDTTTNPVSLQICDNVNGGWKSVSAGAGTIWQLGASGDDIYYNSGANPQVGIGNINPTEALDVTGTIQLSGDLSFASSGSQIDWNGSTATISQASNEVEINGGGGGVEVTVGTNTLDVAGDTVITGTTNGVTVIDALTVEDNLGADILVVQNDGNVGINVTDPTEKLDISGSITITDDYMLDGANFLTDNDSGLTVLLGKSAGSLTTGDYNTILGGDAAGTLVGGERNIVIGSGPAAPDVPLAGTNDYLNIGNTIYGNLASDFVGIGVVAPDDALDVLGNADISGLVDAGTTITAGTGITSTTGDIVSTAGSVQAKTTVLVDGDQLGPPLNCDPDEKLEWNNGVGWSCEADLGAGGGGGGAQNLEDVLTEGNDAQSNDAFDFDDLGAERYCDETLTDCFTVADILGGAGGLWTKGGADDIFYNSGGTPRVGIGDATPSQLLSVANGDLFTVNTSGQVSIVSNAGTELFFSEGGGNTGNISADDGLAILAGTDGTGDINFGSDNTTGQLVLNSGNVGIGDTTPDSGTGGQLSLDVEGNAGAIQYCDEAGNNCFTPASVSGGSAPGNNREVFFNSNGIFHAEPSFTYSSTNRLVFGNGETIIIGGGNETMTGDKNLFVGWNTGTANTIGARNTFLGSATGTNNTSGDLNTFVGQNAGWSNTIGNSNTALGEDAGLYNRSGSNNISIGDDAGKGASTASDVSNNIVIGTDAAQNILTGGDRNTILGTSAGLTLTTGADNILIGNQADVPGGASSDYLNVGDTLFGDLDTGVDPRVGTYKYCDETLTTCFTAADVTGGTLGAPGNDREIIFNSNGLLWTDTNFAFTSAGRMGIGTAAPQAVLEVAGTDAILFPRGDGTNRPLVPVNGMMRYNTVTNKYEAFQNGIWNDIVTTGGGGISFLDLNDTPANYTSSSLYLTRVNAAGNALEFVSANSYDQNIEDVLTVGNDANTLTALNLGGVAVGSATLSAGAQTLEVDVTGDVGATNYCDDLGNDCFTAADVVGGALGAPGNDTEVIFNSGGVLFSSSNFYYDHTTGALNIGANALGLTTLNINAGGLTPGVFIGGWGDASIAGGTVDIFDTGWIAGGKRLYVLDGIRTDGGIDVQFGDLIVETGNVGIGTTNPKTNLDVAGTEAIDFPAGTTAERPTGDNGMIRYNSDNNKFEGFENGIWTNFATGGSAPAPGNDREMVFNSGGNLATNTNFVFDSAGRLGIGTAAPGAELDIDTNQDSAAGVNISNINAGNNAFAGYFAASDSVNFDFLAASSTFAGNIYGYPTANTARIDVGGADRFIIGIGGANPLQFRTDSSVRMTIDGTGNVGIGTDAPEAALDVAGTDSILFPRGSTGNRPGAPVNGMMRYNSTNDRFEAYQGGSWLDILTDSALAAAPDRGVQFNSGGAMAAEANFTYDSAGRLGLGTGAPASELHLHKATSPVAQYITSDAIGADVQLWFAQDHDGTPNWAGIGQDTDGSLRLTGQGTLGTPDMVITDDGDLIVGSHQIDDTTTGTEDSRMYFDVSNSAFRVGRAFGNQWDFASSGLYSAAFGVNTTASGNASMAMGDNTTAIGGASTAMGSETTASGAYSTAMGRKVTVGDGTLFSGFGDGSIAMGLIDNVVTITTPSQVTGIQSLGVFMGDQDGLVVSANNQMSLLGGRLMIDPNVPATELITSTGVQQLELDVEGEIGAIQYCDEQGNDCFTAASVAGGGAPAPGADREVVFNSNGVMHAEPSFTYTAGNRLVFSSGNNVFVTGGNDAVSGTGNTALGFNTLTLLGAGSNNIAVGINALNANISSDGNVAIGLDALDDHITNNSNTAVGTSSLSDDISGSHNTGLGGFSLANNETGSNNVALGYSAGLGVDGATDVTDNVFVGDSAALNILTGADNNVIIGQGAAATLTTGADNLILGNLADVPAAATSNYLNIGGVLTGDMTTATLTFNGTGAVDMPAGTTAQRPTGDNGMLRYNSDNNRFEGFQAGTWQDILTGASIAAAPDRGVQFNSGGAMAAEANFTYTSVGRLGLGTAAPQGLLHLEAGQPAILYFDTTSAISATNPVWRTRSYDDAGINVGYQIETTTDYATYTSRLVVKPDGDLIVGSYQIDDTTTGTEDSRMYFDVSNSAFRAGSVTGNQWDFASAGQYSAAFGLDTTASGDAGTAMGLGTTASGNESTAMGNTTIASGLTSTAMGNLSIASGDLSFAAGNTTTASGLTSTAMGEATTASGTRSTAMGFSTIASGEQSIAMGHDATAGDGIAGSGFGDNSMALGLGNASTAAFPQVTGVSSFGIFMGDQQTVDITASNLLALMGGRMVLDPDATSATNTNVSTGVQQLELDVEGDIGAINFCDEDGNNCFTAASVAGGGAPAPGADREVVFNSNGVLHAEPSFTYTAGNRLVFSSNDNVFVTGGVETTPGTDNVAFGVNALSSLDSTCGGAFDCDINTAIGHRAGENTTIGFWNTFIGGFAGQENIDGNDNVFVGLSSGQEQTSANDNTYIGAFTGQYNRTGAQNVMMGYSAGEGTATSSDISDNVFIGYKAAENILTGADRNTILGTSAGQTLTTGADNIIIGAGADVPTAGTSDHLNIGDTIYGDLATGNVGIGTATPSNILTIAGAGQDSRLYSYHTSSSAGADYETARSASGTIGTDTAVRADDKLGGFRARAYDGTAYEAAAGIYMYVDTGATVADEDIPTHMRFTTRNATDLGETERMRLTSDGDLLFYGTGAVDMPAGTTAQRPTGDNGMLRYNSDNNRFEGFQAGTWQDILTSGGLAAAPDRGVQFNSGGALAADANFTFTSTGELLVGFNDVNEVVASYTTPTAAVVDDFGLISVGNTAASKSDLDFFRARGAIGAKLKVEPDDQLGQIRFGAWDGNDWEDTARIMALVPTGLVTGNNDLPTALAFRTTPDGSPNTTERMRIDHNGNVGIGTTTPSNILTIATTNGDSVFNTSYSTSNIAGSDFDTARSVSGTIGVDTVVRANDKLGGFRALGYDGTAYELAAGIEIYTDVGATVADEDIPTHMRFLTRNATDTSFVERMRLTSDGQLAIGDTVASLGVQQLELDVTGDIGATNYCDADGNNCFTAAGVAGGATAAGADTQIQINSGGVLYASAGLVYTSTGHLGIGTSAPAGPLHIGVLSNSTLNDALVFGDTAGSTAFKFTVNPTWQNEIALEGPYGGDLFYALNGGADTAQINLDAGRTPAGGADDQRITLMAADYVRIGHYTPTSATPASLQFWDIDGGAVAGKIDSYYTSGDNASMEFNVSTTGPVMTDNLLVLNNNGNVGIGTDTPKTNLDIAGTGAVDIPAGTTAERPTGDNGMLRYNSDTNKFEGFQGGIWTDIITAGGSAAAPDRGVQFNSGGAFTADAGFTFTSQNRLIVDSGNSNVYLSAVNPGATGADNVTLGLNAGLSLTSADENVFIGTNAGLSNTSGFENVFIGHAAGDANVGGDNNTYIGHNAGSSTDSSQNTFIGENAGAGGTGITDSVFIGMNAGAASDADRSVYIGRSAGGGADGDDNIMIGYSAGQASGNGENNILIGYDIELPTNTTDNHINIGDVFMADRNAGGFAYVSGTGALDIPAGTTLERPTGDNGMLRYNSDTNKFEGYQGGVWTDIITAGGTPATPDRGVQFNSGGAFTADAGFTYDTTGRLFVGLTDFSDFDTGYSGAQIAVNTDISLVSASNAASGKSDIDFLRARGTIDTKLKVEPDDRLGTLRFSAWDGDQWNPAAYVYAEVPTGLVTGDNDMPSALIFSTTPDGSNATVDRMYINHDGNIGIGTTTPADEVHVYDSVGDATLILEAVETQSSHIELLTKGDAATFLGNAATKGWWMGARGETHATVAERDDFMIYSWDGSTWDNRFVIEQDTGNVGIGTTTPTEPLHIAGDLDDDGLAIESFNGTTVEGSILKFRRSRGETEGGKTIVAAEDEVADLAFYGYDGAAYRRMGYILGVIDGTPGASDMPGRLDFATTADGAALSTINMTIKNDGNILMRGTGAVDIPAGTDGERPSVPDNGMIRYNSTSNKFEGYEAGAWANLIGGGVGGLWTAGSGDDIYYNSGSPQVGIGTTAPSHIFTIASDSGEDFAHYSYSTSAGAGPDYEMRRSVSGTTGVDTAVRADDKLGGFRARGWDGTQYETGAEIEMYVDTGATVADEDMPTYMRFATRSDTDTNPVERMRILSDGKIGIGTSAPINALTVISTSNEDVGHYGISNSAVAGAHFDIGRARGTSEATKAIVQAGDNLGGFRASAWDGTQYERAIELDAYIDDGATPGDENVPSYLVIATRSAADTNPVERMRITSDGYLGIGTDAPTEMLYVSGGNLYVNNGNIQYTGILTDYSDVRLKKDITPLDADTIIGRLAQIDAYSFRMKADPDGQLELGVIAQEVEKAFPELVFTADDEMGTKSVNYIGFIAPLIEATNELKKDNEDLRTEMKEERKEIMAAISALRESNEDLAKEVHALKAHTGYGVNKASMGDTAFIAVVSAFGTVIMVLGMGSVWIRRKKIMAKKMARQK
ncbi:MAG: hypothetical protein DHS20C02_19520 [Micavibrio sp.]|nr:MAG: hypothetical protein DHS20C02_19520 [Micavibrio sp.]